MVPSLRVARLMRGSSSLLMAVSNMGDFALPLTRGICLARLLQPAEFGLAISVTVIASVAELITDLGVNQMAVRNGTPETISTLHSISVIRGLMLAVAIALSGPLFAWLFHAPGTAWVYVLVGFSSLIKSFAHLDVKMRMRNYDYVPEAVTNLGSHIVWTLVSVAMLLPCETIARWSSGLSHIPLPMSRSRI